MSAYNQQDATSDSVLRVFGRGQQAGPQSPEYLERGLSVRAHALAGLGRWREAGMVLDSLSRIDAQKAMGIQAWSVVLGLAPPSVSPVLDSAVKAVPPGPEADYGNAMLHMLRGRVAEGRRHFARALATRDSRLMTSEIRGLMISGDGLGLILQGDSVAGIRRMREGLDLAAAPNMAEESAYLRLQLALALAARPDSRAEGIQWLQYGFNFLPLYLPLTHLALGHAYEAAGQRDSAAVAYGRFLRFWDKADPELQGRVRETKEALQVLTRERPGPP
jgi:tetratricopeptide (TPR) repeat protein